MKANENLMVNDWVKFKGSNLYHQVKVVSNKSVKFDNQKWFAKSSVESIPLTPDILEKNEIDTVFKTKYKGFYMEYHAEVGILMLYVYNNGFFQPTGIGFKYVHELQHALRLCGIEKEIAL